MTKSKLAKQSFNSKQLKFEGSLYGEGLEPELDWSLCDLNNLLSLSEAQFSCGY